MKYASENHRVRSMLRADTTKISRDPTAQYLLSQAQPATLRYFSELNPVFLYGVSSLRILAQKDFWTVRDGVELLGSFFKKFPRPASFKGILCIHYSCADAVPDAWLKSVQFYRLVNSRECTSEKILLLGLVTKRYCDLSQAELLLKKIKLKPLKKVLVSIPHVVLGDKSDEASVFGMKLMLLLYRNFSGRIETISDEDFLWMGSLRGVGVLDLNSRALIADNFMVHRALELGGFLIEPNRLLSKRRNFRALRLVPLSMHHAAQIMSLEGLSQ